MRDPADSTTSRGGFRPASTHRREGVFAHAKPLESGGRAARETLGTSGTVIGFRALTKAMPICRLPAAHPTVLPEGERVRLSRYIVHRRAAPRAANDNRRPRSAATWRWALVVAAAPTLTAALLLSGLF